MKTEVKADDGDGENDAERLGDVDADGEADADGDRDGLSEIPVEGLGERLAEEDGLVEADGDGVADAEALGETLAEGETDKEGDSSADKRPSSTSTWPQLNESTAFLMSRLLPNLKAPAIPRSS